MNSLSDYEESIAQLEELCGPNKDSN